MEKLLIALILLSTIKSQETIIFQNNDNKNKPNLSAPYHNLDASQLLQFFYDKNNDPSEETHELESFFPFSEEEKQIRKKLREDIIVVVIEETIIFAEDWSVLKCHNKGLTFSTKGSSPLINRKRVGCVSCNPYEGDSYCYSSKPILCVKPSEVIKFNKITENSVNGINKEVSYDYYNSVSGVEMKLSRFVRGCYLETREMADALCMADFGEEWRMAKFSDGQWINNNGEILKGGFGFSGNVESESSLQEYKGRFWVAMEGSKANCWD